MVSWRESLRRSLQAPTNHWSTLRVPRCSTSGGASMSCPRRMAPGRLRLERPTMSSKFLRIAFAAALGALVTGCTSNSANTMSAGAPVNSSAACSCQSSSHLKLTHKLKDGGTCYSCGPPAAAGQACSTTNSHQCTSKACRGGRCCAGTGLAQACTACGSDGGCSGCAHACALFARDCCSCGGAPPPCFISGEGSPPPPPPTLLHFWCPPRSPPTIPPRPPPQAQPQDR